MKKSKPKFLAATVASLMLLSGCASSTDSATVKNIDEYIKLGNYKALEYTPVAVEVTDEEVEYEISRIMSENATFNEITDRPIKDGDIANIDYEGLLDRTAFEGGTATG